MNELESHVKNCLISFEEKESSKKEGERKKPLRPAALDSLIENGVNENNILAYNFEAMNIYNNMTREACPFCNRKFLPDRLPIHLRSCGKNKSNYYDVLVCIHIYIYIL